MPIQPPTISCNFGAPDDSSEAIPAPAAAELEEVEPEVVCPL